MIIAVDVLDVVIDDEIDLAAGFRDPMQAHIDARDLADVVVLKQVDPR